MEKNKSRYHEPKRNQYHVVKVLNISKVNENGKRRTPVKFFKHLFHTFEQDAQNTLVLRLQSGLIIFQLFTSVQFYQLLLWKSSLIVKNYAFHLKLIAVMVQAVHIFLSLKATRLSIEGYIYYYNSKTLGDTKLWVISTYFYYYHFAQENDSTFQNFHIGVVTSTMPHFKSKIS